MSDDARSGSESTYAWSGGDHGPRVQFVVDVPTELPAELAADLKKLVESINEWTERLHRSYW